MRTKQVYTQTHRFSWKFFRDLNKKHISYIIINMHCFKRNVTSRILYIVFNDFADTTGGDDNPDATVDDQTTDDGQDTDNGEGDGTQDDNPEEGDGNNDDESQDEQEGDTENEGDDNVSCATILKVSNLSNFRKGPCS